MSLGKYNREERKIANKIYRIKNYLNQKKGTDYPLIKRDQYLMKINVLKNKLNGKYNKDVLATNPKPNQKRPA